MSRNVTHGNTRGRRMSPEYVAWRGMLARCHNPNDPSFTNYGARGIKVCDRWRATFAYFLVDMGPRPSPAHSVDRINNDGEYSPENCRWATRKEQNRNSRHNRLVTVAGEQIPLSVACERAGREYHMVKKRLRRGWPIERALS